MGRILSALLFKRLERKSYRKFGVEIAQKIERARS
jgi:hypothetical protein